MRNLRVFQVIKRKCRSDEDSVLAFVPELDDVIKILPSVLGLHKKKKKRRKDIWFTFPFLQALIRLDDIDRILKFKSPVIDYMIEDLKSFWALKMFHISSFIRKFQLFNLH